ncbi:MAG: PAS domain S-box protein, partial [Candidatus Bipolaricaulaceae bacterium]
LEFRLLRKDGGTRWVRALARRIEFAGRPALLASYVDITEERRLAERLAAWASSAENSCSPGPRRRWPALWWRGLAPSWASPT